MEKITIAKAAITSVLAVRVCANMVLSKAPCTETTGVLAALLCTLYFLTRVLPPPVLPGLVLLSNVPQAVEGEMHWTSSPRPQSAEFYAAAHKTMKRNAAAMKNSEYALVRAGSNAPDPVESVGWTAGVSVRIRSTSVRCGVLSGLLAFLLAEVLVGERRPFLVVVFLAGLVVSEGLFSVHHTACLVVSKDRNHMSGSTQKVKLVRRGAVGYGEYGKDNKSPVDSKGRLRVATGSHLVTTLALGMSADDLRECVRGTVDRDARRREEYMSPDVYSVVEKNLRAFDEKYGTSSWEAFLSNVVDREDAPELFAYAVLPRGNLIFFSAKQAARRNRSDPESPNLHIVCTPGGGVEARERWLSKYMVDIEGILPSVSSEGAACRECREEAALDFSGFVRRLKVRIRRHPFPGGGMSPVPINAHHNIWAEITQRR